MPSGKQKIQSENILYINMDGNILASYNITPGIVINVISKTGQFIQCAFLYISEIFQSYRQIID